MRFVDDRTRTLRAGCTSEPDSQPVHTAVLFSIIAIEALYIAMICWSVWPYLTWACLSAIYTPRG